MSKTKSILSHRIPGFMEFRRKRASSFVFAAQNIAVVGLRAPTILMLVIFSQFLFPRSSDSLHTTCIEGHASHQGIFRERLPITRDLAKLFFVSPRAFVQYRLPSTVVVQSDHRLFFFLWLLITCEQSGGHPGRRHVNNRHKL